VFSHEELGRLTGIDVESRTPGESLDLVREIDAAQAKLDAVKLRLIHHYSRLTADDELAQDTLALERKISPGRASNEIALAQALTHRLTRTMSALTAGAIDMARVVQIDRATTVLSAEKARAVEDLIFPAAVDKTPRQLYELLRRAILQVDPEGATERARKRRQERRVSLEHHEDGVSWLHTFQASEDAAAMYRHIDALARSVNTTDDPRTMDQIRADVHRDLVLGTLKRRVTTQVYVTRTAQTLLGLSDLPGELRGYGPLPADRVRELARDLSATWSGVLVDKNGFAEAIAEKRYRPGKRLRELVELRERTCDHPGCGCPADLSDFDHLIPFGQGGPTTAENGGPKCRRHHRAKQSRFWKVEKGPGGETIWTSTQTRRRYIKKPEPIAPPTTDDKPPFQGTG
jgi:hypothetical protein